MSKVLGVLATGGVAPGINRIVYEALEGHRSAGFEKIVLFRDGFKPLEKGEYGDAVLPTLNKDSISKIKNQGGCCLGNLKPGPPQTEDDYRKIVHGLKKFGVHYLLSPGGDDSIMHATRLSQFAQEVNFTLHQIVIPKTIDNDVNLDPELPYDQQAATLGFDTCAEFAARHFQGLKNNSSSLNRYYGFTAMGRHSGRLAYEIAKRGGADLFLSKELFALSWDNGKPTSYYEVGFSDLAAIILMSHLLKQSTHNVHEPFQHSVVIAENMVDIFLPGIVDGSVRHQDGNPVLADAKIEVGLEKHLQNYLDEFGNGKKVSWDTMGASPRGQDPNLKDQELASQCVKKALRLLSKNKGSIVVYQRPNRKIYEAPFSQFVDAKGKGIIRLLPRSDAETARLTNTLLPKHISDGTIDKLAHCAGVRIETLLPIAWKAVNALHPTRA